MQNFGQQYETAPDRLTNGIKQHTEAVMIDVK
jgi:hypothetical protein